MLASIATIEQLRQPGVYDRLLESSETFYRDLQQTFDRYGLPVLVQGLGARFGLYFGIIEPVRVASDAAAHDHELHRRFVLGCFERGIYFHAYNRKGAPGHSGFSLSHDSDDFSQALTAIDDVARSIAAGR